MHYYHDLIRLFNHCFASCHNTQLVKGGEEPVYLPANEMQPYHAIYFAHGFFSSALHECAHWLIAGEERRKQIDFGYWYEPDGRTAEQQLVFQQVEVKPQALEWILSKASNHLFRVSIDNLTGETADAATFKEAIYQQVLRYCEQGLPKRAKLFRDTLCDFYNTTKELRAEDFQLALMV